MTEILKSFLDSMREYAEDLKEIGTRKGLPWHTNAKILIFYVIAVITIVFAFGLVVLGRGTFPQMVFLVLLLLGSYLGGRRINRVDDRQRGEVRKKRKARAKTKK